jgi:serine protease Do
MYRNQAAYNAGLRPGDIIKAVDGQDVANPSQFVRLIADTAIGTRARIEVLRDGKRSTVRVPVERQQPRADRRRR